MSRDSRPPRHGLIRPILDVMEDRTNPTPFAVALTSDAIGIHGDSAAYVVSGGSQTDPSLQPDEFGTVYVDATSPQEAARQAIIGTVNVLINGTTTTYVFNPTTARVTTTVSVPFVVLDPEAPPPNSPPPPAGPPPAVTDLEVRLEDLTNFPNQSDWDFNDHRWPVRVIALPEPVPGPLAASGDLDIIDSNGATVAE